MKPLTAKHAIISDECRTNRGDDGSLLEALDRVKSEYKELTLLHVRGNGVKFHIKLEVEFPDEAPTSEQAAHAFRPDPTAREIEPNVATADIGCAVCGKKKAFHSEQAARPAELDALKKLYDETSLPRHVHRYVKDLERQLATPHPDTVRLDWLFATFSRPMLRPSRGWFMDGNGYVQEEHHPSAREALDAARKIPNAQIDAALAQHPPEGPR